MARPRYTVYDTMRREYLKCAEQPLGTVGQLVTRWTRDAGEAMRFQGIKTAEAMVAKLGRYSEFVVKNERGEIIA